MQLPLEVGWRNKVERMEKWKCHRRDEAKCEHMFFCNSDFLKHVKDPQTHKMNV